MGADDKIRLWSEMDALVIDALMLGKLTPTEMVALLGRFSAAWDSVACQEVASKRRALAVDAEAQK